MLKDNQMLKTLSPIDDSVIFESAYASDSNVQRTVELANKAQKKWQQTPVSERAALCRKALSYFSEHQADIGLEITEQMGRPISQTSGEIEGLLERANHMIDIGEQALADITLPEKENFTRKICREPWGTVLVVAPWNYPYLTTVNAVIPAIMAGNSVILKPSSQTPLTAQRFYAAFQHAGLPEYVFQYLFLDHAQTEKLVAHPAIHYVAFTGSVAGGHRIAQAANAQFKGVGLELGGKDPAYVCADATLSATVENLVDGAFFNSGQSCCGVERIYVAETLFDDFVAQYAALVKQYKLGNPLEPGTNLGPVVRTSAADFIRDQVSEAVKQNASALINANDFNTELGANYLAPQVLINVDHSMRVMSEETFGPVVGIMPVKNDAQAIALMNDSPYGLTASIWTNDEQHALNLGPQIETGTWFMNRCDVLDPALAWTGVKNTGRGVTLSSLGYEHLTRPKSYHLRKKLA
jgi:acyl-CoA reductase-like NAD-dependent aldehyde dehydrogenase